MDPSLVARIKSYPFLERTQPLLKLLKYMTGGSHHYIQRITTISCYFKDSQPNWRGVGSTQESGLIHVDK